MRAASERSPTVYVVHPGLLSSLRFRSSRHGATMLLTVLIVLASATIAALVVQIAVTAAGSQQRRLAAVAARETVDETTSRITSLLASDPTRVFDEVLPGEDPRRCVGDPTGFPDPVAAGAAWPASCGAYWEYAAASTGESSFRLHPPRLDRPDFLLEVFARVAGERAGRVVHLLPGGRTRPVLYSGRSVVMADLGLTLDADAPGSVYVNGGIDTDGAVIPAGARLAAEEGFPTEPAGAVALTPTDLPTADPTDIRALYPAPLPAGLLDAAHDTLADLACPGVDPVVLDGFTSAFCVAEGETLRDTGNQVVAVPSRADAPYLLMLSDGASQITLYARSTPPAAWPGALTDWGASLGTFPLPVTGLIHADRTVVFGTCDPDGGVCAARAADGLPGVTLDVSLLIVAGRRDLPADVVIGAPVRRGIGALGTLSARMVLPAAATPAGTALTVEGFFALDGPPGGALLLSGSGDTPGSRPAVTIRGSLLVTRPTVALSAFATATLVLDADPTHPPSWMPAPGLSLLVDRFEELTSSDLALLLP